MASRRSKISDCGRSSISKDHSIKRRNDDEANLVSAVWWWPAKSDHSWTRCYVILRLLYQHSRVIPGIVTWKLAGIPRISTLGWVRESWSLCSLSTLWFPIALNGAEAGDWGLESMHGPPRLERGVGGGGNTEGCRSVNPVVLGSSNTHLIVVNDRNSRKHHKTKK